MARHISTDAGILSTSALHDKLYYRLKMVDIDGRVDYSKIVTVAVNESSQVMVSAYPDPFINELFVKIKLERAQKVNLSLINVHGKFIKSMKLFLPAGEAKVLFSPPQHLQKGIYCYVCMQMIK